MLNLMGQFEHRGDHPLHDRIERLEREMSRMCEIEARLLIQLKHKDEEIAKLRDRIEALTLDIGVMRNEHPRRA